jgi:hypothetical protein
MHNHVASIQTLVAAATKAWRGKTWAAVVAPDHGAHLDLNTQRGDHGADITEDMAVSHWYVVTSR